jgi:hypothetical protein
VERVEDEKEKWEEPTRGWMERGRVRSPELVIVRRTGDFKNLDSFGELL